MCCSWWTTVRTLSLNGPTREQSVHNIPICRQLGHWHWHSGSGLLRDNSDHQLHIILKWFSVTFGRLVAVPAWSWLAWRSHSLMRKLISLSISMNVHSKQNRCLKCSSCWTSWKSNYITKSLYQYIWSLLFLTNTCRNASVYVCWSYNREEPLKETQIRI